MSNRHQLTTAERRRGALAAAASKRAKREEARRQSAERIAAMTDAALDRLEQLLAAEDGQVAARAVREVLDRALGRPTQAVELSSDQDEPLQLEHEHRPGVNLFDILRVARDAGIDLSGATAD